MKTLKKALSIILGLAIMLSCVAGMQVSVAAEGTVALSVGEATVADGVVTVPVVVDANAGFQSLAVTVSYDDAVLDLVSAEKNAKFGATDDVAAFGPYDANPFKMMWAYAYSTENVTATGTIATLTFNLVDADAEATDITLAVTEAWDVAGNEVAATTAEKETVDLVTGPVEDATLVVRDAMVSVTETLNARIRVRRSVVQKYARAEIVITPTGYSSTYNEQKEEPIVASFDVVNDTTSNYTLWYNNIGMYELALPFDVQIKCYDEADNYVAYSVVETFVPATLLKNLYKEGSTDAVQQKLNYTVTDMLNMGAAAQKYFASTANANGSDLKATIEAGNAMNKDWTGVGSTVVPELRQDGSLTFGEGYSATSNRTSISVDLSGAPVLSYLIRDISGYTDWSQLKLTVAYTRYYDQQAGGKVIEDVIEGDEWEALTNASRNRFTYKFRNCAMYDANKTVTATLTYAGKVVFTSVYSLENCLYDTIQTNSTNTLLCDALNGVATFANSVRAYFATRGTVDAA